jgi:hypothetical protein
MGAVQRGGTLRRSLRRRGAGALTAGPAVPRYRGCRHRVARDARLARHLITFFKTLPNNTIETKFDLRFNLPENVITKVGGVPIATHLLDLAVAYTLENLKIFAEAEVKAAVPV